MSTNDSNDEVDVDKLLAELKGETSEESTNSKKKIKANDEYNTYETNTIESADADW